MKKVLSFLIANFFAMVSLCSGMGRVAPFAQRSARLFAASPLMRGSGRSFGTDSYFCHRSKKRNLKRPIRIVKTNKKDREHGTIFKSASGVELVRGAPPFCKKIFCLKRKEDANKVFSIEDLCSLNLEREAFKLKSFKSTNPSLGFGLVSCLNEDKKLVVPCVERDGVQYGKCSFGEIIRLDDAIALPFSSFAQKKNCFRDVCLVFKRCDDGSIESWVMMSKWKYAICKDAYDILAKDFCVSFLFWIEYHRESRSKLSNFKLPEQFLNTFLQKNGRLKCHSFLSKIVVELFFCVLRKMFFDLPSLPSSFSNADNLVSGLVFQNYIKNIELKVDSNYNPTGVYYTFWNDGVDC